MVEVRRRFTVSRPVDFATGPYGKKYRVGASIWLFETDWSRTPELVKLRIGQDQNVLSSKPEEDVQSVCLARQVDVTYVQTKKNADNGSVISMERWELSRCKHTKSVLPYRPDILYIPLQVADLLQIVTTIVSPSR